MLVLGTLIFLMITTALAGVYLWLAPTRAEQRLQDMAGPKPKSEWTETVVKLAGPLAKLSTPEGNWEGSSLRLKFLHAGIRHPDARLLYFASKTILPLVLAALAFLAFRAEGGLMLIFYMLFAALVVVFVIAWLVILDDVVALLRFWWRSR